MTNILRFDEIGMSDLAQVGGKNASLGEMVSHLASAGIRVPRGSRPPPTPSHGSSRRAGSTPASAPPSRASTSTM